MGFFSKLADSGKAFVAREKIAAYEAGLIYCKENNMPEKTLKHLEDLIATAWSIPILRDFFESLNISFDDYRFLYRWSLMKSGMRIVQKKLFSTWWLIDSPLKNPKFFQYLSASLEENPDDRQKVLQDYVEIAIKSFEDSLGEMNQRGIKINNN